MENEDEDIFFWFVNVRSFDEEEVRQLIDKRDEFTASCDCIVVVYDWCDYFMMKGTAHKAVCTSLLQIVASEANLFYMLN